MDTCPAVHEFSFRCLSGFCLSRFCQLSGFCPEFSKKRCPLSVWTFGVRRALFANMKQDGHMSSRPRIFCPVSVRILSVSILSAVRILSGIF